MARASPAIVTLLLEHGADPFDASEGKLDGFMYACATGNVANLHTWLQHLPDWNLGQRNGVTGGTATSSAVFFGANKLETLQFLLDHDPKQIEFGSEIGGSILSAACEQDDADPSVIGLILSRVAEAQQGVNYRMRGTTKKWRLIQGLAKVLYRTGLCRGGVLGYVATQCGATALHLASARGDVEVVKSKATA